MQFHTPSIGMIFLGGHSDLSLKTTTAYRQWVQQFLPLHMVAQVTPYFVPTQSSHLHAAITTTATIIRRQAQRHTGFVVLFDDRDFLYAANILSLSLGSVQQPIVCVAPQLSAHTPEYIHSLVRYKHTILEAAAVAGSAVIGTVMVLDREIAPVTHATTVTHGWMQKIVSADQLYYGQLALTPTPLIIPPHLPGPQEPLADLSAVTIQWQAHGAPLLSPPLRSGLASNASASAAVIDGHATALADLSLPAHPTIPTLIIAADQTRLVYKKRIVELFFPSQMTVLAKWIWSLSHFATRSIRFSQLTRLMSRPIADEYFSSSNYERLHL